MIIKENLLEKITSPEEVASIFRAILTAEHPIDQAKEHFWSIGLDGQNRIAYIELVSLGILNASPVHPRETFRMAILKGVQSLIIAHNHPSGSIEPSQADQNITKQLVQSGEIIGIKILDHVIITSDCYTSLNDRGLV